MNLEQTIQDHLGQKILNDEISSCVCDKCQVDMIQLTIRLLEPDAGAGEAALRGRFNYHEMPSTFTDEQIDKHLDDAIQIIGSKPHHD